MTGISTVLLYELLFFIAMNVFWVFLYKATRRRERTVRTADGPLVSVIMPVYNKVRHLNESLASLAGLTYANKEIIVVDDGSTDGGHAVCMEWCRKQGWTLLTHERNAGKAAALNTGIAAARGELVLTVDADSQLAPDSLGRMAGHFQDPRVGAVAGMVSVGPGGGLLHRFQSLEYFHQAFQRMIQGFFGAVMVLPGPISLYRKMVIAEAGGFDNSTLVEDWDMTMKVHKLGYTVLSVREAESRTVPPQGLRAWWKQRTRWSRGGLQILGKHTDVLRKSRNKAMTNLMFPIHVMWLVVPLIVVPTMVYVMLPSITGLTAAWGDFMVLLGMLKGLVVGGGFSIMELFRVADIMVADFLDFRTFGILRLAGYASGLAFLWFTFVSLRSLGKEFTPRHFLTVLLMPAYWMLTNMVYLYALWLEAVKGEFRW